MFDNKRPETMNKTVRGINMRLLLAVLGLLLSVNAAQACRYYTPTDKDKIDLMEAAYYGVVSGVRIPAYESAEDPRREKHSLILMYPRKKVRIAIFESFKGPSTNLLEIDMFGCGGGSWFGEIGDTVIAYQWPDGHWWIEPASESLELLEKQYGDLSP